MTSDELPMNDLEILEHRMAQWFELPLRSVMLLDELRFAQRVSQMEAEIEQDAERRRAHLIGSDHRVRYNGWDL